MVVQIEDRFKVGKLMGSHFWHNRVVFMVLQDKELASAAVAVQSVKHN